MSLLQSVEGRRKAALVGASTLALTGTLLLGCGIADQERQMPAGPSSAGHDHGVAVAPPSTAAAPTTAPVKPVAPKAGAEYVRPKGTLMQRSQPVRVRVPAIGVSSQIVNLGLQSNRQMEVPTTTAQTGWYDASPTPGELGPAILAGHVTLRGQDAVFLRLGTMKEGQRIEVDRKDGSTAVFQVEQVAQYSKSAFPTDKVYGSIDRAALRLITCGGVLDGETKRYSDNVVVYASLVAARKA